ncbi:MAG: hypothetical protein HY324_03515, partial [Chlamydiia bacterium]|nr:hypothetical protein [Chlamydiia bacterium]
MSVVSYSPLNHHHPVFLEETCPICLESYSEIRKPVYHHVLNEATETIASHAFACTRGCYHRLVRRESLYLDPPSCPICINPLQLSPWFLLHLPKINSDPIIPDALVIGAIAASVHAFFLSISFFIQKEPPTESNGTLNALLSTIGLTSLQMLFHIRKINPTMYLQTAIRKRINIRLIY